MNQDPSIDAGELRHRILFLEETITTDASGSVAVWAPGSPPDETWAKIDQPRGRTEIRNGQDVSQVDAIVTVRCNPNRPRKANMRFQDKNGNTYLILAIAKPLGMNVLLVMQCLLIGANV